MTRDQAMAFLAHAWRQGRLAQSFLIEGQLNGAAMEVAERLLAMVFCPTAPPACETCRDCRLVLKRRHPDVQWVEPELKSRRIDIERMHELRARLLQTSYEGGWKAGVIVAADRLGPSSANAFLKLLEEPPPRTCLILVSDAPQFILSTIASRCQRLAVSGGPPALPEEWSRTMTDILRDVSAETARGFVFRVVRPAVRIEGLLSVMKAAVETSEGKAGGADDAALANAEALAARVSARMRALRAEVMRGLLAWCRDILVQVCGGPADVLYYPQHRPATEAAARRIAYRDAVANCRVVEAMQRRMDRSLPDRLVLTEGFSRMRL